MSKKEVYIRWFESLGSDDLPIVGGKNASLGEMISALKEEAVRVPDGFAVTAAAYWKLVKANHITQRVKSVLADMKAWKIPLEKAGKSIRDLFMDGHFPEEIAEEILNAYYKLSQRYNADEIDVAVRSSATAEDLPEASFAGQQDTFLNVTSGEGVLKACQECYASLFTDRAISYREEHGFDHIEIALSIGIQKMVRSDKAASGVIFTIDTETGFPNVVIINAAWGLGESVVQGKVTPDEYTVFKPLLNLDNSCPIIGKILGDKKKKTIYSEDAGQTIKTVDTFEEERQSYVLEDEEVLKLARWACAIEKHYNMPMDIEWAMDGDSGELFIVQARPETVQSRRKAGSLKRYTLTQKGEPILKGLRVGEAIAASKVSLIKSVDEMDQFIEGSILVTEMTDPDWGPIMKNAAGIVTDSGGRTCHAAIVSRELGVPAIVGTREATKILKHGQEITLSCAEGDQGYIYDGILEFEESELNLDDIPETQTRIMLNIASPDAAFRWWRLPRHGIGLARMEFIITDVIRIHPMALVRFDDLKDKKARKQIEELTRGYEDKTDYFVDHLSRGIAKISASQYPEPVIVRMSDFKTNEYANLIGGEQFEPKEWNPMLGFRGASRYYSDSYREGFALECRAIRRVREEIGLDNVLIMIPFCRTLEEADRVLEVLAENGLKRGERGLQVYVMAEIPSNIILAEEFAERFDGFSIGSNDLTQFVLAVDRDSAEISQLFDERNEAIKRMIKSLIQSAHKAGRPVGICGQAPSDYPDFAAFLVEAGIDSISLNPDSVVEVKRRVAQVEGQRQ